MKNKVKKYLKAVLLVVAVLVSGLTYAQPPGGQGGGKQGPPPVPTDTQIEKMVDDMADEVGLSETQETKVLALYKEHFAEVKAKTSGNSRPDRSEMEALKTTFEKEVKALLSSEQKTKYAAYQKKNQQQKPQR